MLLRFRYILSGLLVFPCGMVLSQTQSQLLFQPESQPADSTATVAPMNPAEDGLELLETLFGNHDPRLVEALEQLAEEQIALGQLVAAPAFSR